jgi:hypothetical protein
MKRARPMDHSRQDLQRPDGARALVWVRRGRIRWAVLGSSLALAAAGVAGCGSDGDATAANANANAGQQGNGAQGSRPNLSSDQKAQLKKFRDCMKQKGVDLPDFGRGGPPQGGPPAGFDPTSSKFRSAIQKCGQYAPQGGPPGGQGSQGGPPGGTGGAPGGGPPGFGGDSGGGTY